MSNLNQELEELLESILGLIWKLLKGCIRGVFRGIRRLHGIKAVLLFLASFLVCMFAYFGRDFLFSLYPEEMPGYFQQGIYYLLLGFPVFALWCFGQPGKGDAYERCLKEIGFKGKDGKYPVFIGKNRAGRKDMLHFKSTIPLVEWKAARERLETALDCNIIKMEYGKNKRLVKLTTLPSSYQIPAMVEWKEEYLSNKGSVLTIGVGALEKIQFDLNRVPHVLAAGETGSGKSVILRCMLWQMIEKGARVYMIDFKGGVEFGKRYESYGEVITERKRALEVLSLLTLENQYRLQIFRDLEVKNLDEYNRKVKQNLCRIGVFTDELAEMLDKKGVAKEEKQIYEQIEGKLSTLARLSRATGIHLFIGVQRPDANVLTGQIKNNIPVRISGRFADKTASEIVLGSTDAVNLPDIKGRFLYKVGNEVIEFQSFYFNDDTMLQEVSVEQGDMLTEAAKYTFTQKSTVPKEEQPKEKPGKKKIVKEKKQKQEKRLSDAELEEQLRQMDEEDLNINFDEFDDFGFQ